MMLSASRFLLRQARCISKHRKISTGYIDPIIQEFTSKLATKQPLFSLHAHHIRVLHQPSEFYSLLLDSIRRAQHRVFLSSLYIGSEDTEILDTLICRLNANSSLHVYFQLDLNRSTRPGPSSTAKLLLPLLERFPSRVHVSMFRSPSLRGFMARIVPPRFNEGWGTWHAKIYGVDDEVIITGANLNKSYFTNRQDRYIHFRDQPLLAQYCFDFLQAVSKLSFRLRLLPNDAPKTLSPHSYIQDDYMLSWEDADTHPHHINDKAKRTLSEFQSSRRTASQIQFNINKDSLKSDEQALLFPIIQAGQFGIQEEESCLKLLFRSINIAAKQGPRKRPLLDLTSGYFSLYQPYQKLILGSPNLDCRIVAASPKANGFFGSSGISGRIPEGYTYFEKGFVRAVRKAGRLWQKAASGIFKGVQLLEWDKPGWTYHAKGIWLSPSSNSLPILTLFGSTNLNSRSACLDTELSFIMVLPSRQITEGDSSASGKLIPGLGRLLPEAEGPSTSHTEGRSTSLGLRESLRKEIENIRANTSAWKGYARDVRFSTKLIVWLVKDML